MNALIHKTCGAVVVYSDRKYQRGQLIKSKDLKAVDGTDIDEGSEIICPFCHDTLRDMHEMRQLDIAA